MCHASTGCRERMRIIYMYSNNGGIHGAYGLVDKSLDSRSKDLGFDSYCWSCVEEFDKLLIPYCLFLPNSDGYLVKREKLNCNDFLWL